MRGRLSKWANLSAALTALAVITSGGLVPKSATAADTTKQAQQSSTAHKPQAKSTTSSTKKKSATSSSHKKPSSSARKKTTATKSARRTTQSAPTPAQMSYGQKQGLHVTPDPLALRSSVALVIDQDTDEVLFSKNPKAVLPIASITKLMTAVVVTEAAQPLDETLAITQDDVDTEKGSHSRLVVGTSLTRGEMMHLALMSSENRAAHALGRNYPGGLEAFVKAMNLKAQQLGMNDTHYVDPTGLSSSNQSSAHDLALLVKAAYQYDLIRSLSTSPEHYVAIGSRELKFRNTNALVMSPQWSIGLQKTGYISEAGRCLVMQAELAGRKLIMVLLDSAGRYSRIGDAERLRHWLTGDASPAKFVIPQT